MIELAEKKAFVNDITKAKIALKNINWNFYEKSAFSPNELRPFNPRAYHWYPATFIPEIPFTLIEALTPPRATVWDPFSGIGTTFFQALSLSRYSRATEICTVAVEYMKSLFTLFDPTLNLLKVRLGTEKALEDFASSKDYSKDVSTEILVNRLEPWFSSKTLNQLCFLFIKEKKSEKEEKAIYRICISALLKTASSQDRGWGCVADNVLPKEEAIIDKNVLKMFKYSARRLTDDISQHRRTLSPDYKVIYREMSENPPIFHEDLRVCNSISDNSIDLIVTSPPYPNMTDYVTSQRLSYYYLGFDLFLKGISNDGVLEIGARSRRNRKNSVEAYYEDMKKVNKVISKKLRSDGYACYILPAFNLDNDNNKLRRQAVQKVIASMTDCDLIKEEEYERILPQKRRSHNRLWATLEREKIYLFRKV